MAIPGSCIQKIVLLEGPLFGFKWLPSKRSLIAIAIGQFLSLLLTCTGVTSQLLAVNYNVNAPTTQSLLNYLLLCAYTAPLIYQGLFWPALRARWWRYLILAFLDVEANYFVVKAYQYTNLTSITLLDCFTIPSVMVLSFFLMRQRFSKIQLSAVLVCIVGLVILVTSDAYSSQDSSSSSDGQNQVLGDALVLFGSFLYACSNIGQEISVKEFSPTEYLSMIGLFGSLVSCLQLVILERNELESLSYSWEIIGLIVGFALSLFLLYSTTPYLLIIGGATLMNLSFLTSDVFSVIAGVVIFDYIPSWMYFLSFVVIVSGLVIYNLAPGTTQKTEETTSSPSKTEASQETITVVVVTETDPQKTKLPPSPPSPSSSV